MRKDGSSRAPRVLDRKDDAVQRARAQAQREHAELVIMDGKGRIPSKDSHGRDPRSIKG